MKTVSFDIELEEISSAEEKKEKLHLIPVGFDEHLHKKVGEMIISGVAENIIAALEAEQKFLEEVKRPPMIEGQVRFPSPYRYRLEKTAFAKWFPVYTRNVSGFSGASSTCYLPLGLVPDLAGKTFDLVIKGYRVY